MRVIWQRQRLERPSIRRPTPYKRLHARDPFEAKRRLLSPFLDASSSTSWAYALGTVLTVVIAWVNIIGAQTSARLQFWIVVGKLGMTVALAMLALRFGTRANLSPGFAGATLGSHLSGTLLVLIGRPFWFTGFDVLPQALRDRDPSVKLSLIGALLASTIIVSFFFYAMVILTCAALVPRASLFQMAVPRYEAFVIGSGSNILGAIVILLGFLGVLSGWNATVFAGARIMKVMSDAHLLPRWVSGPSDNVDRPVILFSAASLALSLIGSAAIVPFITASSITLTVVLAMCCAAVLGLRRLYPDLPRPYRIRGSKVVPVAASVIAGGLVVLAALDRLLAARWRIPLEWRLVAIWVLLGATLWAGTRRLRGSISPAVQRACS